MLALLSDKDLCKTICPCRCEERLLRMKCDIKDGFVELLAMRRDLLYTSSTLKVPETDTAVMTCQERKLREKKKERFLS
jgi:hypothetical protein